MMQIGFATQVAAVMLFVGLYVAAKPYNIAKWHRNDEAIQQRLHKREQGHKKKDKRSEYQSVSLIFASVPCMPGAFLRHRWQIISMLGFAYGSFLAVFPGFTVDQFGAKDNSIKYGLIYFGLAAGGFIGPIAMSRIYASSGSYRMAFVVVIVVVIFGLLMTVVFRIVTRHQQAAEENAVH